MNWSIINLYVNTWNNSFITENELLQLLSGTLTSCLATQVHQQEMIEIQPKKWKLKRCLPIVNLIRNIVPALGRYWNLLKTLETIDVQLLSAGNQQTGPWSRLSPPKKHNTTSQLQIWFHFLYILIPYSRYWGIYETELTDFSSARLSHSFWTWRFARLLDFKNLISPKNSGYFLHLWDNCVSPKLEIIGSGSHGHVH